MTPISCNLLSRAPTGVLVILGLTISLVSSSQVTIDNTKARRDINGSLMDAHDGMVIRWSERYYWYGMGYRNCTEVNGLIPPFQCPGIYKSFGGCGFREDHAVNVYSSVDLVHWQWEGDVLPPDRPQGIYFRPKIIFNDATAEYVMWVNYLPPASTPLQAYPKAAYLVFVSHHFLGPFQLVSPPTGASVGVSGGGDFTLFKDLDGLGYLAYDAWGNSHTVVVEKLSDSYYDTHGGTSSSGPVSPSSHEAPIMFKRGTWYYLLFGHTCCFCEGGAGSQVWVARHPLGPWEDTGTDLNPQKHIFGAHRIPAQENYVITVSPGDGNKSMLIYTGDRWSSAPDKLKSHDLQYWEPLVFDDTKEPPIIAPLVWMDNFTIAL